ncbi:MAG: hypothetical protein K9L59_17885 [Desulfobacterales bacterium]|nr:hypothetical protein [Desulfobacterales bacterium]
MTNIPDNKRRECADYALHAYGTAYIFEKKAANIQNKIRILSFLGVAVPACVGAIVGSYSLNSLQIGVVLAIASTIAIVQLLLSIWSLASGWDRKISEYLDQKNKNYEISDKFRKLGNETLYEIEIFQRELEKLNIERNYIKQADDRHSITEKEKRKGMRYALRKFQRPCAACCNVPTDMKTTNCGVCGQF